jgi:hypothetical protein
MFEEIARSMVASQARILVHGNVQIGHKRVWRVVSSGQGAADNGLVHVPHGKNVRHGSTWPVVSLRPMLHDNVPMAHLSCRTLDYAGTGHRRHFTGCSSQPPMWLTPMGWPAAVAVEAVVGSYSGQLLPGLLGGFLSATPGDRSSKIRGQSRSRLPPNLSRLPRLGHRTCPLRDEQPATMPSPTPSSRTLQL